MVKQAAPPFQIVLLAAANRFPPDVLADCDCTLSRMIHYGVSDDSALLFFRRISGKTTKYCCIMEKDRRGFWVPLSTNIGASSLTGATFYYHLFWILGQVFLMLIKGTYVRETDRDMIEAVHDAIVNTELRGEAGLLSAIAILIQRTSMVTQKMRWVMHSLLAL
ncbi:hypothetical protein O6H91_04G142800 [Diphasiastrum complanatum]|uniref:Uncharacterized protein n=1 Tax=Diphasiastrum complanatum TaxID=34168 RepID=A0ACC2E2A2_DIPCM|nr:hypothetical protein O6H91_04G142800 [Diphasiastrum complanatum]